MMDHSHNSSAHRLFACGRSIFSPALFWDNASVGSLWRPASAGQARLSRLVGPSVRTRAVTPRRMLWGPVPRQSSTSAPPVPACHFCLYTGPHSQNISLTISGNRARWARPVPVGTGFLPDFPASVPDGSSAISGNFGGFGPKGPNPAKKGKRDNGGVTRQPLRACRGRHSRHPVADRGTCPRQVPPQPPLAQPTGWSAGPLLRFYPNAPPAPWGKNLPCLVALRLFGSTCHWHVELGRVLF